MIRLTMQSMSTGSGVHVPRRLAVAAIAVVVMCLGVLEMGFIERLYSLQEIMDESTNIMAGKIVSVDSAKQRIIAQVERNLKGKSPYQRVQMTLMTGDQKFLPFMFARIKPGDGILVFYKLEGQSIACLCFVNGFWYQLFAEDEPKNRDNVWWRFSHVEIHMNRTWQGSQSELAQIVEGVLAGKRKPPTPNQNLKPLDVRREMTPSSDKPLQGAKATAASPTEANRTLFGRHIALPHAKGEVRGAIWVDYDGDGDLDVYFCCSTGNRLYRFDGGITFRDVTAAVGLREGSRAAAWADYNGDGKLDLLLSTPKLYTNHGGKFTDDTNLLPRLPAYNTEGCGWLDYDGDGAPDILLTNGESGIALFKNEQNGKQPFRDVSRETGLGPKGPGNNNGDFVSIADWDGDGFSDFLYNVGQGLLFRNTGKGRFEVAAGAGVQYVSSNDYKIGTAWGDYDNDGDLDLYVPQKSFGKLFRNNNDGTFTDVTRSAGDLPRVEGEWTAATWGDVDRDGWLDLHVGKANGDARLFVNQRDGTFENQTQELGLYRLPGNQAVMGAALGDFDGDGDLDILANSAEGVCTVFINDAKKPAGGPTATYLAVRPTRTQGAVGATVRLLDARGRLMGLQELGMSQNMGSQTPLAALFGVARGKYKVTICMSDGQFGEQTVEVGDKGLAIALGVEGK